jgi:helicase
MLHPKRDMINQVLTTSQGGVLLHMATGSGKTYTALEHALKVIESNGKVIFVTPARAQANELYAAWSKMLHKYRIGIYTGEYTSSSQPTPYSEAQLLVMTPEKLDACTRFWRSHWSWIPEVKLLIVDELHLLNESQRGARLEGALSRWRRLNPIAKLIGMSATIGNSEQLAKWLQVEVFQSSWRPIPLEWNHVTFKKAEDKKGLLINLLLKEESQSIIFVQSRRKAEELSACLRKEGISVAHHHAGLEKSARECVESDFRQNKLTALVCTPTLEMGVNLPAGHVFIYDAQQYDGFSFLPITTNSAWQRAGRAGRPGLDKRAIATIFTPEWSKKIDHILNGDFEDIQSSLIHDSNLAEQIIAEIASGFAKDHSQLLRNLNLYFLRNTQQTEKAKRLVQEMLDAEMLVEFKPEEKKQSVQLRATRIGKLASRHMLQPATILLFKKVLDTYVDFTVFDCFIALCSSNDCEPIIPIDFVLLNKLQVELLNKHTLLLQESEHHLTSILNIQGRRLVNTLYMACMLDSYCHGESIDCIADNWGCYPFELRRLIESTVRLIVAFKGCILEENTAFPPILEGLSASNKLSLISNMLQSGLRAEVASLTFIDGIGPKLAKKLCSHDIKDLEDLSNSDPGELSKIKGISYNRAKKWINSAFDLIENGYPSKLEQWQPLANLDKQTNFEVDAYRLIRSKELKVKKLPESRYRVEGGLEPHFLQIKNKSMVCDCIDYKKGYQCKHILAVKTFLKDPLIIAEFNKLQLNSNIFPELSLKNMWASDLATGKVSWR